MINKFLRQKNKNVTFLCQITESHLKVIKCLFSQASKREFVGLEVEAIPPDIDDKRLSEKLTPVFKKLGYNHEPVIVSLPRSKVTCRYLKVPTQKPTEIENIVSLQASKYLPYNINELVTGYQILSVDKEGYSDINMVIAHKDAVERYLRICKELKTARLKISLSSYGLVNFYSYIKPEDSATVMIIDIDSYQVELAIISHQKLLFSRYFKINRTQSNWESLFINEINKTRDAYLKEAALEAPIKIIVVGTTKTYEEFIQALHKQTGLPVEIFSYENINISGELLERILVSDSSFASIIGLGLKDVEESLNLLPQDIKAEAKRLTHHKEQFRLISFIVGIILILGLGVAKNLANKALYLKQLKVELNKITNDAKPLEGMEKRLKAMQRRLEKKPSSVEVLYEIHRIIPSQISLLNFSYEDATQVILRGQTPELNSVFTFVSQLEKSPVFKNFNIKVRYATKKRVALVEVIDFEIVCLREE